MNQSDKSYLFDQPGRYQIFVHGQLSTSWSSRLSDMEIIVKESVDQQPVITLSGEVRDQAALFGVLNTLYDMRCTVLKVAQLNTILLADDRQSEETSPPE